MSNPDNTVVDLKLKIPARIDEKWVNAMEAALNTHLETIHLLKLAFSKNYRPCLDREENPDGFHLWLFSVYAHCGNIRETTDLINNAGARKTDSSGNLVPYEEGDVYAILCSWKTADPELNRAVQTLMHRKPSIDAIAIS